MHPANDATAIASTITDELHAMLVKRTETLTGAPASLFSIGDAVQHPMFGDGKVESIKEDKLTIIFDGNVTKVIREDFVTRKK